MQLHVKCLPALPLKSQVERERWQPHSDWDAIQQCATGTAVQFGTGFGSRNLAPSLHLSHSNYNLLKSCYPTPQRWQWLCLLLEAWPVFCTETQHSNLNKGQSDWKEHSGRTNYQLQPVIWWRHSFKFFEDINCLDFEADGEGALMHSTKRWWNQAAFFLAPRSASWERNPFTQQSVNSSLNVFHGVPSHAYYCLRSCVMLTNPLVAAIT